MKPTTSISTLRANKFSVINCTGNICQVQAGFPFFVKMNSGEIRQARRVRADAFEFCFRGQFSTALPKQISA